MKVLWKSLDSEKTGRASRQHAYIPKVSNGGNERNITLCGRFKQIGDDGKAELFDNMYGELLLVADACKICLKKLEKINY